MGKKYREICTSQLTLGENAAFKNCIKEQHFDMLLFAYLIQIKCFTSPNHKNFFFPNFPCPQPVKTQFKCQRADKSIYGYAAYFQTPNTHSLLNSCMSHCKRHFIKF